MSTAVPGRVVCARCSANNFDTQAACWKCGAPLVAGGGAAGPAPVLRPTSPPPPGAVPHAAVSPAAVPYVPGMGTALDPSVAIWAGAALAIFFPYCATIAGIIFLMLDDRRKAEIGRITLILGIIFSILHSIVTVWMIEATIRQLPSVVTQALGSRGGALKIGQPEQPKLTDPVTFPTN